MAAVAAKEAGRCDVDGVTNGWRGTREHGPIEGARPVLHAQGRVGASHVEQVGGNLALPRLARPLQRSAPVLVRRVDGDANLLAQPAHDGQVPPPARPHERCAPVLVGGMRRQPLRVGGEAPCLCEIPDGASADPADWPQRHLRVAPVALENRKRHRPTPPRGEGRCRRRSSGRLARRRALRLAPQGAGRVGAALLSLGARPPLPPPRAALLDQHTCGVNTPRSGCECGIVQCTHSTSRVCCEYGEYALRTQADPAEYVPS